MASSISVACRPSELSAAEDGRTPRNTYGQTAQEQAGKNTSGLKARSKTFHEGIALDDLGLQPWKIWVSMEGNGGVGGAAEEERGVSEAEAASVAADIQNARPASITN
jgi:hypothetical protein